MYMFPAESRSASGTADELRTLLMHALPGNRLDFGINLYYIKGENMIQAVPVEGDR